MVSSEQLETISKGFVPKNTEKNTKWAVSTFKQHETSVALWARLEISTSSQSQWTKTVNALNFAVFCVFLLLKPTKPTVSRIHPSSTTHNTSVVPSALFNWFSPKLHNQCASVQGINSELPGNEYLSHCSCGR